jgi:hypothetical protein
VALQREGLFYDPIEKDGKYSDEQEFEETIHERGYQPLEEEQESPHNSIEYNGDVIKEQDPKEEIHEEDHQIDHDFPCKYVEEENFNETHHVEDLIHEEAPHEDEASLFSPLFDEFIQASIPLAHEKRIW